jgi:hypothetical protein
MSADVDAVAALLDSIKVSAPTGATTASDPIAVAAEAAGPFWRLGAGERAELRRAYTPYERRSFAAHTVQCLARALDRASLDDVWAALMLVELGVDAADWREQLLDLLVLDHALARLAARGLHLPRDRWRQLGPESHAAFVALDRRHPEMRNIASVGLAEVVVDGRTTFVVEDLAG